jgi:hypothetical protein
MVRVVGKAMLLHLPQLVQQPGFSALWVAVLNSLAAAAAAGPEGLNDASAAALQNLIIMLHEMVSWGGQRLNLYTLMDAVLLLKTCVGNREY